MKQSKLLQSIVNGQGALGTRASVVVTQLTNAQDALISELNLSIGEVDLEIIQLTDLAPESTTSLTPGTKNINAKEFIIKLQELKKKRMNLQIELDLALETKAELLTPKAVENELSVE